MDVGVGSSSGATRRSQEMVRMALANLRELAFREAIRFVAISCMASSACVETEVIKEEVGYRAWRRRM